MVLVQLVILDFGEKIVHKLVMINVKIKNVVMKMENVLNVLLDIIKIKLLEIVYYVQKIVLLVMMKINVLHVLMVNME